jgi:hypothetical protein
LQSIGSSLARVAAAVLLIAWQDGASGVDNVPDDQFCEGYANQAVAQAEEAARHPTCALTGPRWDTDRDNHLAWCEALDGPPELATVEVATRHAALITCMMSVYGTPPASSVRKAADSGAAEGKIEDKSDPRKTGTEPPNRKGDALSRRKWRME